jgi:hypothetical protein
MSLKLLLALGALLWVASRVHVALRLMGIPVFNGSALELTAIAVYLIAAVAVWIAARSVFGRPFIPRIRAVAW